MVIRIFNQPNTRKEIPVKTFLQRYKTSTGIVRQTIKSYLIEALNDLKHNKLIKPYYIVKKNYTKKVEEEERLTKLNYQTIVYARIIIVYENI